jgi:HEAT repeat protein
MFDNMKVDQLRKQLYHDRADKRVSAVQSLCKINTPPATEVLEEALRNPNKDVRLAAAECMGYETAVNTLMIVYSTLTTEYGGVARYGLIETIGCLRCAGAVEALTIALFDPADIVRDEAAKALKAWGESKLLEAVREGKEIKDKIEHLIHIDDPRAFDIAVKLLENISPDVRGAAAQTLSQLKDMRTAEPFAKALGEKSHMVRDAAAEALVELGACDQLCRALEHPDDKVRQLAANALGRLGDPRAVNPLLKALKDYNLIVRAEAAYALGNLGDLRATEPLTEALEDRDQIVRRAAAKALGVLNDERAIDKLIEAYSKESYEREEIICSLIRFKNPRCIDTLIEALDDTNHEIVRKAEAALVEMRDPGIAEKLFTALNAKYCECVGVVRVLGEIRYKPAFALIAEKIEHKLHRSWEMRKEAALALIKIAEGNKDSTLLTPEIIERITAPHTDNVGSTSESSDCSIYHIDKGIGIIP